MIKKFYQLEEQLVNLNDDCSADNCNSSNCTTNESSSVICVHHEKTKIIRRLLFAVVQEMTCDYEKLTIVKTNDLPSSFCRECMAAKFKVQCPKHRTITLSEIREQLLAIRDNNMRIKNSLPESVTQDVYDKILADHEKSQERAMLLVSVLMNNFSFLYDPVLLEKMVQEKLLCPNCVKNRFIGKCSC